MLALAVICTLIGGAMGAFVEPISLSVSIPIAIMGGFIIKAIKDNNKM